MKAETAADIAGGNPLRAARRVFLRHSRRRYPDTGRCSFCGGAWLVKHVESRLISGCAARQYAADHLARAGHLDQDGHLIPSLRHAAGRNGA